MRKLYFATILALFAAAFLPAADGKLEDVNWVATELMGKPVIAVAGHPTANIQMHSVDKKLTGFSGCNSIFGGYDSSHEGLKFDPVGATRVACLDHPHMEPEFLQALTSTVSYRMPKDLELLDKDGKVIARFQASGPADTPTKAK